MDWKTLIKQLTDKGMTQMQIARKVGCSQQLISKISLGSTADVPYSLGCALIDLNKRTRNKRKT